MWGFFYTFYLFYKAESYTAESLKLKLRRLEARGLAPAVEKLESERLGGGDDAVLPGGDERLDCAVLLREAKRRAARPGFNRSNRRGRREHRRREKSRLCD